jgi:hypothetical protein
MHSMRQVETTQTLGVPRISFRLMEETFDEAPECDGSQS